MLSQTAEYALRAVLYLAEQPDDSPVRVGEMADALGIPQNYLSKTLHALVRTGVLASVRGPSGGFHLARAADRLPLLAVVQPFDDIDGKRRCLLGRPACTDRNSCAAHEAWKNTSEQVTAFFRLTMVGDLCARPPLALSPSPSRRMP
jgi:Rrf2 family protein